MAWATSGDRRSRRGFFGSGRIGRSAYGETGLGDMSRGESGEYPTENQDE